ncbi:Uridine nucleosidase 1 [Camellia lanceoleosa]|uniref:Uridine nucleosidase 1 n=1 Tax=Camellia lanceoleosa TaxID=1840588 RepID=A0ACC0GBH4_9ERIC|nr:Uridine nucleosidase 1 [Camellia lanceoleosa]
MESGSGNGDSEVQRTMLELLNQLDGFEHHSLKLATFPCYSNVERRHGASPLVIVIGGGFVGMAAAQALRDASFQVEPRPGVLRLMDEAKDAGKKLAVCSAATKSSVVLCLENLVGIWNLSNLVITLRNRYRAVTTKQALMADQSSLASLPSNHTIPISSFCGSPRYQAYNYEMTFCQYSILLEDWPDVDSRIKFSGDLVTVTPDIFQVPLSSDAEFILLASDGLWDYINSSEAVNFVRNQLRQYGDDQLVRRLEEQLWTDVHKIMLASSLLIWDDSVAIFMAFQTPQLEVLGLTTIFGNVTTEDATRNALILGEIAGYPDVPVAEGSPEPLKGGTPDVAYFIHGSDGLGNTNLPPPKSKKIEKTASEFWVDMVSEYPSQVSILALGPLTNLALAVKKDSSFASKVKRVVILGGSFFALGNVNPAAEANIYGDPEAADIVFTSGANFVITGINITTQVIMTDADLDELRQSEGRHAQLLSAMCKCYRDWHVGSLGVYGIFLHDPVSFVALVRPDLFTYKKGVVRVGRERIYMGHTLLDH